MLVKRFVTGVSDSSTPQQRQSSFPISRPSSHSRLSPQFIAPTMSTRSRTKSTASMGKAVSTNGSHAKSKTRRQASKVNDDMDVDSNDGKENVNLKASAKFSNNATAKKSKGKKETARTSLQPVDCICARGDDGSPMIYCSECKIWWVASSFSCLSVILSVSL